MRQNVAQFATGFAAVTATLFAAHFLAGNSPAKAESFETRFAAVATLQKSDRLNAASSASGSSVVFYNDPRAALTIATKIEAAKDQSSRERPIGNARQEKDRKLPVGCEPSFSPVTTPSMANVTGRCLSALDGGVKVAELRH